MVSYLQVEGLTKSVGDRLLFADVTFGIFEGDKIGLIAQNGKGKSTLLNILAGKTDYDSGRIVFRNDLRVGYLDQEPQFDSSRPLLDNVAVKLSADDWDYADRAVRMLSQLKLPDPHRSIEGMSGGELKRAAIARVLLLEPQMLILDEPTNHLDVDMIEWLEDYLTRKRVTLLMVTHDRYFLDKVCNKIFEIDRTEVFSYDGNFDYYLRKREERMEALSAELARVKNLLRTEREWMRRQPQARGSKAKYRIDSFHDLEKRSRVNLTEKQVELQVKGSYIGSKIFEARNISKAFGDKVIVKDWNYDFARYEKVGIVGENGAGKSTFLKMLLGEISPDTGRFDVGTTVRWGYYSQAGISGFDESKKVIDAVREVTESIRIDEKTTLSASQFLNRFLFTPEDQQKYIYRLSGGEKRRLYLATVLMQNPNFLVLDEPTNDLDIVTLSILEDYLANFKGCVIVVSHDRFFLDRIADHLFIFKGDGEVRDFPGNYSEYRHCVLMEEKERKHAEKSVRPVKESSRPATAERKPKLTYKEKKELEALEGRLERLYAERKRLEEDMSSGRMTTEEIMAAGERIRMVIDEIDEAEMRSLELMEKES